MKKYYQERSHGTDISYRWCYVSPMVANAGKAAGADIALTAFVRFNLGKV